MVASRSLLAEGLSSAESYPSSAGRQLLQYYGGGYGYNRGYHWSGGRIAGVVIGGVCFAFAIFFAILACTIRRRRMAKAHNSYPAGTYPQANQYPQAGTYPNQPYPQNTEGYNPAAYNTNGAYPNTATGTPVNGQNGVQMSALPHEKAGYQSNV